MSDAETTLSYSIPATAKYLVVGAAIAALGWGMIHAQMALLWVLGGAALLSGPLIVIGALLVGVRVGPCPSCGSAIEQLGRSGRAIACEACTEYLEADGGRLRRMDEGALEDEPTFKLWLPWWSDLKTPTGSNVTLGGAQDYVQDRVQELLLTRRIPARTMPMVWPGGCSVCGAPPTRAESLALEVNAGHEGTVGVVERKLVIRFEGIPHCAEHQGGVRMATSPGECGRVLLFRSLSYRNAVRRVNGLMPVASPLGLVAPPRDGFSMPREDEVYRQGETIMSARVCGPLLLAPYLFGVAAGSPVVLGWKLLWPAIAIGLILWGYLTPLPKLPRTAV